MFSSLDHKLISSIGVKQDELHFTQVCDIHIWHLEGKIKWKLTTNDSNKQLAANKQNLRFQKLGSIPPSPQK